MNDAQPAKVRGKAFVPTERQTATKGMMAGMRGVYLTAAELSAMDMIVSPTSRSPIGADLLVTDHRCHKAWSVQVKTNGTPRNTWLLNAREETASDSPVYVCMNIHGRERIEYFVVPSKIVENRRQSREELLVRYGIG